MLIRQETAQDHDEVNRLVQKAFAGAEHADGNEADLVAALRQSAAFVPELSLVAQEDGRLVGYILFTEGRVGADTVLILAPLAVLPEYQRRGIGTALIREGHRIAEERGYAVILVLGSTDYYPRFGYRPAEQFGILVPDGLPAAHFMAIRLRDDVKPIGGAVTYPKEFGI